MPTLPRSPASSIHSWSFVYLNPAGYAMSTILDRDRPHAKAAASRRRSPLPLVERQRNHPRARTATADVDLELRAWLFGRHRDIGHANRLFQIGRLSPAGDFAGRLPADDHVVPRARDARVDHLEPDQLAAHAFCFLRSK